MADGEDYTELSVLFCFYFFHSTAHSFGFHQKRVAVIEEKENSRLSYLFQYSKPIYFPTHKTHAGLCHGTNTRAHCVSARELT